ncbi:metallo-beta-lactamase family protein [Vibrio variabilis]|uniref:Metallo-beta-lactamase family protein n=1 Tax=Vibrio variabilis TaxID=990271 RepID=A0ABQ0JHH5_9VIBR|nr:metallo-beta-lactamase family protein [Vibrio variabilis]
MDTKSRDNIANALKIEILSGSDSKSPAAILLQVSDKRFLLDAGASIYEDGQEYWSVPDNLDGVFISHDHWDHIGGLGRIPDSVPVYCSAQTAMQLKGRPNLHLLPICGVSIIHGIKITTGAAGHAIGGIWFHFDVEGGVFYSGDYSIESRLFRFDTPPPAKFALLDYSYTDVSEPLTQQLHFVNQLKQPTLFPCPASGRSTELALWLMENGHTSIALDEPCTMALKQLLSSTVDNGLQQGLHQRLTKLHDTLQSFSPSTKFLIASTLMALRSSE